MRLSLDRVLGLQLDKSMMSLSRDKIINEQGYDIVFGNGDEVAIVMNMVSYLIRVLRLSMIRDGNINENEYWIVNGQEYKVLIRQGYEVVMKKDIRLYLLLGYE